MVAHKIDAFRPIIEARLPAYPLLSSVRLFEQLKAAGYVGGYTPLKEYVRRVRPVVEDPVVRFETPPGRQAQVDFAHFRLPWGRRWALLAVLGYSRLLWLRFYRRQDMGTLFSGLEQSFAFFEGVARELLFDQMKSVIVDDQRLSGGRLVENPEFIRFANHRREREGVRAGPAGLADCLVMFKYGCQPHGGSRSTSSVSRRSCSASRA